MAEKELEIPFPLPETVSLNSKPSEDDDDDWSIDEFSFGSADWRHNKTYMKPSSTGQDPTGVEKPKTDTDGDDDVDLSSDEDGSLTMEMTPSRGDELRSGDNLETKRHLGRKKNKRDSNMLFPKTPCPAGDLGSADWRHNKTDVKPISTGQDPTGVEKPKTDTDGDDDVDLSSDEDDYDYFYSSIDEDDDVDLSSDEDDDDGLGGLLLSLFGFDYSPDAIRDEEKQFAGIEPYAHPDYYILLPLTRRETVNLIRNATFEKHEGSKRDAVKAVCEANDAIRAGEKLFDVGKPGDWTKSDCEVCLVKRALRQRDCCGYKICNECTSRYVAGKVEGIPYSTIIECPNCDKYMTFTEVRLRLRFSTFTEATDRYYQTMRELSLKSDQYLCHNCGKVLQGNSKSVLSLSKATKMGILLDCDNCHFSTCAQCKSPWHADISCKEYQKGEKSMLAWAKGTEENRMATRCPGCKSWFQRSEGCDHMTCSRCRTGFYYQCGCRHYGLPNYLGSHSSKLSVFGCKNIFLKKHPVLRKTIRASLMVPVVTLAVPLAIPVGAVGGSAFLIGYGGYKLGKTMKKHRTRKRERYHRDRSVLPSEGSPVAIEWFGMEGSFRQLQDEL